MNTQQNPINTPEANTSQNVNKNIENQINERNIETTNEQQSDIKILKETDEYIELPDPLEEFKEKYKNHKAGFVNIIGNPNVGKSTLMNNMLGEKLSIVTHKAQTTRHRIFGIVNGDNFQIVYSDTPGILKPAYKLHEAMLKTIDTAIEDADIILYVTDVTEDPETNKDYIEKIKKVAKDTPKIVVINKIDLADQAKVQQLIDTWKEIFPDADIVPASALYKFNLDKIFNLILEKLPYSPPYFDKDMLTDRPMRFFVAEIIREKILELYKQEIPYSVEVGIEEFKELPSITKIRATIYVSKESQKPILIGKGGQAIKRLGIAARKAIEEFLGGQHVYLDLYVKVSKNWRNDQFKLKMFGYEL